MWRFWIVSCCLGFLTIGAAGSAGASTLAFTGSLTLEFGPILNFGPRWRMTASGAGFALVNGSGTGAHLSSLALAGGTIGPITTSVPSVWGTATESVRFTGVQNLSGSFTGLSGGPPGGGPMGLSGLAKVCYFSMACPGWAVPLAPSTGGAGFGIGGTQLETASIHTAGTYTTAPAVGLTIQHASWTIGTRAASIHTPSSSIRTLTVLSGFAHGPASLTSSAAQPSGALQLVTVSKVFTTLTGAVPELPLVSVLNLHFVPEPGTLLLFGSVMAALAVLGRRRGA
jgi:hypothetical protein